MTAERPRTSGTLPASSSRGRRRAKAPAPGESRPGPSLGIDLGTTRTVVARVDRGNYPVVPFPDEHGDAQEYLPSLTALTPDGLVHGFAARAAAREGAPLLRSLKRRLSSPRITPATEVELGGRRFTVLEILTDYLRHLRAQLKAAPGMDGTDPGARGSRVSVAVAVPAHAFGAQRLLTLEAFGDAGFNVIAMLNEPSAAGFEYTHRKARTVSSKRTRVLVYDLGGGTFDTSLVDVRGVAHEVLASRGLGDLGGDDVDLLLAQLALERAGVREEDLDDREVSDLLDQCRDAKEALAPQTRRIALDVRGKDVIIQTAELYEACKPLLERSLDVMEPLIGRLADGDPDLTEVAGVHLVGGGSALPLVPRMLRERFGARVHRSPYPGASTAIGLAIASDRDSGYDLIDRLSRGFGVFREADDGRRTTFDAILGEDAIQAGATREGTVITREYTAVHNIGCFRFVECAGVDADGEPRGELAPYQEIIFPFDPALRDEDLSGRPVERTGAGRRVQERYEIDSAGLVQVTITDLEDGFSRRYVLGRQTA